MQRCHIVPDSLGGKDEPENIVLLCKRCHADGPNVTDPDIMDILRRAGIEPEDDIKDKAKEIIERNQREVFQEGSIHFGQPYYNTATIAGLYRMLVKELRRIWGRGSGGEGGSG